MAGSTNTLATRVKQLLGMQGSHSIEAALLNGDVESYTLWNTEASGTTYHVLLDNGLQAFHKRHDKVNTAVASGYGHDRDGPPIHECAAWHFAKRLGPTYADHLPATVYRNLEGGWGSLALRLEGQRPGVLAFPKAVEAVNRTGFFDTLVGQQDRHPNNYFYDPGNNTVLLFDHGYCFPAVGYEHRVRSASLQRQRRFKAKELTPKELELIDEALASGDLLGIEGLLEPARAARMGARLNMLQALGEVPPPDGI